MKWKWKSTVTVGSERMLEVKVGMKVESGRRSESRK
jgi:hypothetical protein